MLDRGDLGRAADAGARADTPALRCRLRLLLHEFDLPRGETVIGRGAACGVTIFDPLLSREHVAIVVDATRAVLNDLGSVNGTRLNGVPLQGSAPLHNGDRIALGHQEMIFLQVHDERLSRPSGVSERSSIATPFQATDRQNWWLDLQLDLLERALADGRATEADAILRFVAETLDKREHEPIDRTRVELLVARAVRFALLTTDVRWLGWSLGLVRTRAVAPSARTLIELQIVPPSLLVDVADALDALVAHWSGAASGAASGTASRAPLDREQARLVAGFEVLARAARG